nr:MAG: hypothetical protein TU35_08235 [Thermoproteus sp. AZ2]
MGLRESRPKLIFYFSAPGFVKYNADLEELKIYLKLKKPRCRRCGAEIAELGELGYAGVFGRRSSFYCSRCIRDMYHEVYSALKCLLACAGVDAVSSRAAAAER